MQHTNKGFKGFQTGAEAHIPIPGFQESVEVYLDEHALNKDVGFKLKSSWKPQLLCF